MPNRAGRMRALVLAWELTIARGVPEGRLNLAQDAVLGRGSRDEKSRRDDWKLPASLKGTAEAPISKLRNVQEEYGTT